MDVNFKAMVILVLLIIGLFAGGLFLVIQDSNRREIAYETMQKYLLATTPGEKAVLEAQIKEIIDTPPLVRTSRASLDSWDEFLNLSLRCNDKATSMIQLDPLIIYMDEWKKCMDDGLSR